ncbi:glycosyltransferase family 2 protein [Rhodobacteraceae bacterium HSP-20]|uniref:Glycosyltransferase family 2 protein n=1 Tax=Paragemmobacter amnigenus TaxID=2852097 RepID=A0ABS6J7U4_9RHOB|nr:glycosyltransferase family 2 protein [Rhodobacter amnigenus]MBV4391048.1 glycosyltransferase family 2 protein [Rhodobacter amnigenus]
MRYTVVCSVKDEGPFLVEWVCWQRMLGFTDVVVVTNDCTDRSPALLDALEAAGWVRHLRHDVPDRKNITARKLAAAKELPEVAGADWVMVADVDEFLVVHAGAGKLADLLDVPGRPFLGMSIPWRIFGTSWRKTWEDGLLHRQCLRAGVAGGRMNGWVKSIHRKPDWFGKLGEHSPKRLRPRRMAEWGSEGMIWVNPAGAEVTGWTPEGDSLRILPEGLQGWEVAQVNHYMLRSAESFSLKRGTLSPVAGKDRYTTAYYDRAEQNAVEDRSALRHAAEFDALHAQAMALPDVRRLHHLACADYVRRLAEKAGRVAEDDPRLAHHLAAAGE